MYLRQASFLYYLIALQIKYSTYVDRYSPYKKKCFLSFYCQRCRTYDENRISFYFWRNLTITIWRKTFFYLDSMKVFFYIKKPVFLHRYTNLTFFRLATLNLKHSQIWATNIPIFCAQSQAREECCGDHWHQCFRFPWDSKGECYGCSHGSRSRPVLGPAVPALAPDFPTWSQRLVSIWPRPSIGCTGYSHLPRSSWEVLFTDERYAPWRWSFEESLLPVIDG